MNLKFYFICAASFGLIFLTFSNGLTGKSAAKSLTVNQTPPLPTPVQTMVTPVPSLTPAPTLNITPTMTPITPSTPPVGSNPQITPLTPLPTLPPVDPPPGATPVVVVTVSPTVTFSPTTTTSPSPTEVAQPSNASWLPWIIAGVLFVIVVFLIGRQSKK
jgi:hypothetical protein